MFLILIIKFYNRSIHTNFQTNEAKRDLLSVNLVYIALERRRQQMSV